MLSAVQTEGLMCRSWNIVGAIAVVVIVQPKFYYHHIIKKSKSCNPATSLPSSPFRRSPPPPTTAPHRRTEVGRSKKMSAVKIYKCSWERIRQICPPLSCPVCSSAFRSQLSAFIVGQIALFVTALPLTWYLVWRSGGN